MLKCINLQISKISKIILENISKILYRLTTINGKIQMNSSIGSEISSKSKFIGLCSST